LAHPVHELYIVVYFAWTYTTKHLFN